MAFIRDRQKRHYRFRLHASQPAYANALNSNGGNSTERHAGMPAVGAMSNAGEGWEESERERERATARY